MSQHDPIAIFLHYLHTQIAQGHTNANAVALTTQDENNDPDIRVVLVKDIDNSGLVFYTNYSSRKGQQLAQQAVATLSSLWSGDPHIVITGCTHKVDEAQSDCYFALRPRLSQISAIASRQSQPIASRKAMTTCFEKVKREYANKPLIRPSYWGGYRLVPKTVLFHHITPDAPNYTVQYRHDGHSWSYEKKEHLIPSYGLSHQESPSQDA